MGTLGVIMIVRFLRYRKVVVSGKIVKIKSTVNKENKKEIDILAQKCWDKAREEGIKLPRKNVAVCSLKGDPYTWVIVKLGIYDRIIYKCRMSISDVAEAKMMAEEKEEGT